MALIPTDVKLWHIVWSGTLNPSAEEIFAYGRYAYSDVSATADDAADEVQGDVTDMLAESTTGVTPFPTLQSVWPSHVHWTQVKASQIDKVSGALVGEPAIRALTDVGSGATSAGLPYQDALAISYEAAAPNRKRRNRFYLPPMQQPATDGHGRVIGSLIDDLQTQIHLAGIAHSVGPIGFVWCIRAAGSANGGWEIDRYHTGDVTDTIRRRRNKLPEVRHTLVL